MNSDNKSPSKICADKTNNDPHEDDGGGGGGVSPPPYPSSSPTHPLSSGARLPLPPGAAPIVGAALTPPPLRPMAAAAALTRGPACVSGGGAKNISDVYARNGHDHHPKTGVGAKRGGGPSSSASISRSRSKESDVTVCFVSGPPPPLALIPPPTTWPLFSAVAAPANKVMAKNVNGTVSITCKPSNESELQLYRVLQRANLLNYFDTFIAQGGDDVHQLCEAGEEEFLEIMALVGMATKPLHVRRLQKALHEWVQNPALFHTPLVPLPGFPGTPNAAAATAAVIRSTAAAAAHVQQQQQQKQQQQQQKQQQQQQKQQQQLPVGAQPLPQLGLAASPQQPPSSASITSLPSPAGSASSGGGGGGGGQQVGPLPPAAAAPAAPPPPPSLPAPLAPSGARSTSPAPVTPTPTAAAPAVQLHFAAAAALAAAAAAGPSNSATSSPAPPVPGANPPPSGAIAGPHFPLDFPASLYISSSFKAEAAARLSPGGGVPPSFAPPSSGAGGNPADCVQVTPILSEVQIQRIAETAQALVASLPPPSGDSKTPNHNLKKVRKEVEIVMAMSDDDPRKIEEVRRFSAIYGRFDCKRKPEKPLTMHEVSVNEAAAQLCLSMPTLLTRRDELFPLARQVVRNSGYQYSKGHSRSQFSQTGFPSKLFGTNINIAGKGGGGDGREGSTSPNGGGLNGSGEDAAAAASGGGGGDRPKPPRKRMKKELMMENDYLLQKRRERVDQITEELRMLIKRMDELRSAAGHAGATNDAAALNAISQQLEAITLKHNNLIQEQRQLAASILQPRSLSSRISTSSESERMAGSGGSFPAAAAAGAGSEDEDNLSQQSYSTASPPTTTTSAAAAAAAAAAAVNLASASPGNFVLSASGGQIIAVQNPALSMSAGALHLSRNQAALGATATATLNPPSSPPPPRLPLPPQMPPMSTAATSASAASSASDNSLLASQLHRHQQDVKPYVAATLLNLSRRGYDFAAAAAAASAASSAASSNGDRESPSSSSSLVAQRKSDDVSGTQRKSDDVTGMRNLDIVEHRVKDEPNSNPSSPISVGRGSPAPTAPATAVSGRDGDTSD